MAHYYQDEEWSASETEESHVAVETRSRDRIGKLTMKKLEVVNINKIGQKLPVKKDDALASKKGGLSEYELQIQRNIDERKKMFQMLNLGDAKKELAQAFGEPAVKRKATTEDDSSSLKPIKLGRPRKVSGEEGDQPVVKKYKYTKLPEQPLQMALRERKTNLRYNERSPKKLKEPRAEVPKKTSSRSRKKMIEILREKPSPLRISLRSRKRYNRTDDIPDESIDEQDSSSEKSFPSSSGSLTLSNTYFDQGSPEESIAFVEDVNEYLRESLSQEPKKETIPSPNLLDFVESLKTFDLDPDGSVSLIPQTTCLTWHPNANHALLAAANKMGSIGFWDCDYDQGDFQRIRRYDVHSKSVSALSFDGFNPYRMFSTGEDGSVHYLDFRTGCFDQIHAATGSKNVSLTHHAQVGASSLLVSQDDGNVMLLDTRAGKPVQQKMACFDRSILMLSPHPVNENNFMASTDKNVGIFDLRKTRKLRHTFRFQEAEPVLELPDASVKLRGALFSPLTGNMALTIGPSLFEIFDLHHSSAVKTLSLAVVNKNYTINRASWYPNREDIFVVNGSDDPDFPRDIGLRHVENGEMLHSFESNSRYKASEISAFHSSLPIFAVSGNCSKVNLYRSSS